MDSATKGDAQLARRHRARTQARRAVIIDFDEHSLLDQLTVGEVSGDKLVERVLVLGSPGATSDVTVSTHVSCQHVQGRAKYRG